MDKAGERGLSRFPKTAGWRAALAAIALGASGAELPASAQGVKAGATAQRSATNEKKGVHIERANRAMETHKLIEGLGHAISTLDREETELSRRYPSLEAIEARLSQLRAGGGKHKTEEIVGVLAFIVAARTRYPVFQDLADALIAGKDPGVRRWAEKGNAQLHNFLALPQDVREMQILLELRSSFDRGVRVQI